MAAGAQPPFNAVMELRHAPFCYWRAALLADAHAGIAEQRAAVARLARAGRIHSIMRRAWSGVEAPVRVPASSPVRVPLLVAGGAATASQRSADTVFRGLGGSAGAMGGPVSGTARVLASLEVRSAEAHAPWQK